MGPWPWGAFKFPQRVKAEPGRKTFWRILPENEVGLSDVDGDDKFSCPSILAPSPFLPILGCVNNCVIIMIIILLGFCHLFPRHDPPNFGQKKV